MRRGQLAFTLIELLLALGIFSILALLAYGGLNSVLSTRETVALESSRLAEVQRGFVRLARDFSQVSPRAVRDNYGDVQPAIHTGADVYSYTYKNEQTGETVEAKATVLIELTVAGRRLLPGQKRSSLQRIAYAVHDNSLLRLNWSVLDRAQDSKPYVSVMLPNVDKLKFRFLKSDGEWLTSWTIDEVGLQQLPIAVEVTFEDEKWGALRRVFQVS